MNALPTPEYVLAETHRSCYVIVHQPPVDNHHQNELIRYDELNQLVAKTAIATILPKLSEMQLHLIVSYLPNTNFIWKTSKEMICQLMTNKKILDLSTYQTLTSSQLIWIKNILPNIKFRLKFPAYDVSNTTNDAELTKIFYRITFPLLNPTAGHTHIMTPLLKITNNLMKMVQDANIKNQYNVQLDSLLTLPVEVEACLIDLYLYFKKMMKTTTHNTPKISDYDALRQLYRSLQQDTFDTLLSIAIKYYLKKHHIVEELIKKLTISRHWPYVGHAIWIYFLSTSKEREAIGDASHRSEIEKELERRKVKYLLS